MSRSPPSLVSVVLPTDTYDTIAPVLESLRGLEAPQRLEVVLVSPQAGVIRETAASETSFHSVVVVHVESLTPLPAARAAGAAAATSPYIFLGETHSYLWPDALGLLLEPLQAGTADVVVPGFVNGNPATAYSWASFLMSYARWGAHLGGESGVECPPYDFLARRDVLCELGDSLPSLLADGNALGSELRLRRWRTLFTPAGKIDHVNIEAARPCLHEHFLQGVAIGKRRAAEWSLSHRLAFIAASWLVPPLLFVRSWRGIRPMVFTSSVPPLTLPVLFILLGAKACGEVVGCAGFARTIHPQWQTHYEIRRLDHASPRSPR